MRAYCHVVEIILPCFGDYTGCCLGYTVSRQIKYPHPFVVTAALLMSLSIWRLTAIIGLWSNNLMKVKMVLTVQKWAKMQRRAIFFCFASCWHWLDRLLVNKNYFSIFFVIQFCSTFFLSSHSNTFHCLLFLGQVGSVSTHFAVHQTCWV